MSPEERIAALLQEAATLDPEVDTARLSAIYCEAATLVDRTAKPKKWAALRCMYAKAVQSSDPHSALAAFREALSYFDKQNDHSAWSECKSYVGWMLAGLGCVKPPESEEVIDSLEATIDDYPYTAALLATYYAGRALGDPLENWDKQMKYLKLALQQVSPQADPVGYAKLNNSIANLLPRQPDGDFATATESRIGLHYQSLNILKPAMNPPTPPAQDCWVMTYVNLNEAYQARIAPDMLENCKVAEQFARDAYEWSIPPAPVPPTTRQFATLSLVTSLLDKNATVTIERAREALKLATEAVAWVDERALPVDAANVQKFIALAHQELIKLGEPDHLEPLLKAADKAYALLDPALYADSQRTIMQIASSALLAANDFTNAIDYLRRAVTAGEVRLSQSTSRAARLEAIFNLHDSYASLGFCLLQAGQSSAGIEAIDAGKGRLWRTSKTFANFDQIKTLIPPGGALLFPVFVAKQGLIAVVTPHETRLCPLPAFGHEQLTTLLLADIQNPESDSWLARYIFRDRDTARWLRTIDAMCARLYEIFWEPIMSTLSELGITQGAELLCFPQAGLGSLPLHAAYRMLDNQRVWIHETYALRYAPSASCLLSPKKPSATSTLLVSDPVSDLPLPNCALELHWLRECLTDASLTTLCHGEASKAAVVAGLPTVSRAHFSTHAQFRVDNPFSSCLLLAGGEPFTLDDILPLLEHCPLYEVVLSCCETAAIQSWRRADESLGFPSAFLDHGVSTVTATQWPVDDWASATLMGRFYRERKTSSPAQAMRRAQVWMRTVTADELLNLLQPLKQQPDLIRSLALKRREMLMALEPDSRPLAHPFYWAAFTVSGL